MEEARACLLVLKLVRNQGCRKLVVEGDNLALVSKLKKRNVPNTFLGFYIYEILLLGPMLGGGVMLWLIV